MSVETLEAPQTEAQVVPTKNQKLIDWVNTQAALCRPDRVVWCDGTDEEFTQMCDVLVENGTAVRLNPQLRPNSILCRS